MTLSQERIDLLIEKLENFSQQHPHQYKLRVRILAFLGYGYIFLVLLGAIVPIGAILWSIWLMISIGIGWSQLTVYAVIYIIVLSVLPRVVVQALFISIPKPQGIELRSSQFPALFYSIDRACKELHTPKFKQIILTSEFNAAVGQIPRFGLLGWYDNYLMLGLPLMQSLSVEQFQAVIAHELGHISRNHDRFSGWIYHQSMAWEQILDRLVSTNSLFFRIFATFFNWYVPFFSAYSFVLRRSNEYEADRCAAILVGEQKMAEALISIEVRSKLADSCWNEILAGVDREMFPPKTAFTNVFTQLKSQLPAKSSDWLEASFTEVTNNFDTHPCLGDRLSALGYIRENWQTISLTNTLEISAAEQLLGEELQLLTEQFDRQWYSSVWSSWQENYFYSRNVRDVNIDAE